MIYILRKCPTEAQIKDMLSVYGDFIKLAVDIHRRTLAGGGKMHADCEAVLLDDGSKQRNVWGADWYPFDKTRSEKAEGPHCIAGMEHDQASRAARLKCLDGVSFVLPTKCSPILIGSSLVSRSRFHQTCWKQNHYA